MSRFASRLPVASVVMLAALTALPTVGSAQNIIDNSFDVSFNLFRSFGAWTGPGPDQTGGLIFSAGGEGVARGIAPGIGAGDDLRGEVIENRRPFGGGATGNSITELQINASESVDAVRDVRRFDATGLAVITFDYTFNFTQTEGDGVTPINDGALAAQLTTPGSITEFGLRFFDGAGDGSGNRTIVGGLFTTPFTLISDGLVRSVSFTLPVATPAARAALDTASPANNFDLATVFFFTLDGPVGRRFTFDNVTLTAVTPAFLKGDFNFDGEVLDSDISGFVSALTGDFASLIALFPARTEADFTFIGDFNGDSEVLDSDITGFVSALLGGGGRVGVIPEPAALSLLVPGMVLLRRRGR